MSKKKQVQEPDRSMVKIDPRLHKDLKQQADETGMKFGKLLDELLIAGAQTKGIQLPSLVA